MPGTHVDDEIAGALVGALERGEGERVAAHVAACERCAQLRQGQRDVLAALAEDVDDLAPRPAVKARLLAEARASAGVETRPARPRSLLPFRMDRASSNRFLRWASLGVAAAFIIGLVGGVSAWALVLGDRLDRKDNQLDASRDALETLVHSDKIATMDGSINATPVRAAVGVAPSGTGAVVMVSDVPPASSGQGYHLWLFSNGTALLAAVLTPDGHGDIVARLTDDMRRYDRLQLEIEPLGSTAPGGTVVVAGRLP